MTKVDVEGVGYTEASAILGDGNRWAAVHADELSDALAGTAAMAGDSSFADEFAASYDQAAAAVVTAYADVVDGFGSLCRLAFASLENHTRAEVHSITSTAAWAEEPSASSPYLYVGGSPAPPSSLGGDPSSLPGWATMILDHIEGFVWPDADLDRLRTAASAWRTAAGHLEELAVRTADADKILYEEWSPEVLLAVDALNDFGAELRPLAETCRDLATCCEQYAEAVEQQREAILDLVHDLIRDAILIAALGAIFTAATGGTSNAVTAYINAGKLAAEASRFRAFLDTLRTAALLLAGTLDTTATTAISVQSRISRFARARAFFAHVARTPKARTPSFLERHEGGAAGGHTLAEHVGKTDDYLRARLAASTKKYVSTFTSEAAAEGAVRRLLSEYSDEIALWLKGSGTDGLPLQAAMGEQVGRVMTSRGEIVSGSTARTVLVKDSTMPEGFRILTAYVKP